MQYWQYRIDDTFYPLVTARPDTISSFKIDQALKKSCYMDHECLQNYNRKDPLTGCLRILHNTRMIKWLMHSQKTGLCLIGSNFAIPTLIIVTSSSQLTT